MYEDYLKALLAPLRVYDLRPGTINGAELYALGKGFDGVSEQLDLTEREALTATAEDEGLSRREALFARRPAAFTPEERRAAIAALLQIDGDSLTPAAINRTLGCCGSSGRRKRSSRTRSSTLTSTSTACRSCSSTMLRLAFSPPSATQRRRLFSSPARRRPTSR